MSTQELIGDESFWNWRPQTYDDPSLATICNIAGTVRRRMARDQFENGGDELPDLIFAERLGEHDRNMWTRLSTANMGGEFLPPMKPREIEIARVELLSTTGDVYSIRARTFRGRLRYRVEDEYDSSEFILPFDRSDKPLTLRELFRLLEEFRFCKDSEPGLVRGFWHQQIEAGDEPEEAVLFATVKSVLYEPRLTKVYQHLADLFIASFENERPEDDEEGEPEG
jgi:hypothetical protein